MEIEEEGQKGASVVVVSCNAVARAAPLSPMANSTANAPTSSFYISRSWFESHLQILSSSSGCPTKSSSSSGSASHPSHSPTTGYHRRRSFVTQLHLQRNNRSHLDVLSPHTAKSPSSGLDSTLHDPATPMHTADTNTDISNSNATGEPSGEGCSNDIKIPDIDITYHREFLWILLNQLEEKNVSLFERIICKCGVDTCQEVLRELESILTEGGMMTSEGDRQRTKGGTFIKLLKQRVKPEDVKLIWSHQLKMQQKQKAAKNRRKNEKASPAPALLRELKCTQHIEAPTRKRPRQAAFIDVVSGGEHGGHTSFLSVVGGISTFTDLLQCGRTGSGANGEVTPRMTASEPFCDHEYFKKHPRSGRGRFRSRKGKRGTRAVENGEAAVASPDSIIQNGSSSIVEGGDVRRKLLEAISDGFNDKTAEPIKRRCLDTVLLDAVREVP